MSNTDPYKRHATRTPGITYRTRRDGSRSYHVYAQGRQLAVDGGEREALAKQAELRTRTGRGERIASPTVRFGDLAEEWFQSKHRLRPWTLKDYRAALDNVLLPRFGRERLPAISVDAVAALIHELEQRGLSGSRIDNLMKPLKGTIKLALRRGIIAQNPFDLLTADERPKRDTRARYVWSPDEIAAVLDAARTLASRPQAKCDYSTIIEVAIFAGLRLGELLGLQWQDVDLRLGYLNVRRQWTRSNELAAPKTPTLDSRDPHRRRLGPPADRAQAPLPLLNRDRLRLRIHERHSPQPPQRADARTHARARTRGPRRRCAEDHLPRPQARLCLRHDRARPERCRTRNRHGSSRLAHYRARLHPPLRPAAV